MVLTKFGTFYSQIFYQKKKKFVNQRKTFNFEKQEALKNIPVMGKKFG